MTHPPRTPLQRLGQFALWAVGLLAALVGIALAALLYLGIPQNAAGMAAKGVCSAAFVAGRPWQTLLADDVLPASPVLGVISLVVDEPAQRVTARFAGLFPRTAVMQPNRGCVLDLATSATQSPAPTAAATAKTTQPWPLGDVPLPAANWGAGLDAPALQKTISQAFVGAGNPLAANARGLAVLHKGRLLVLQTAPGFSTQTPLHGWSMTKTVGGMLMHKLSVDTALPLPTPVVQAFAPTREPAWLGAWQGDARKNIRLADLMYMRDGLASTEDYDPWGSVPQMLWGQSDTAAYAAKAAPEAAPGARWRYLSASANLMASVARGRFTGPSADADYWAYPAQALFGPIGATTAVLETDAAGNWVASSYLWASVGDWARLGQLMLNDGRWGDVQVLPPGWLKLAATPSTGTGEGTGYGAQTWLMGQPTADGCKNVTLPPDTLAMEGHWGQLVALVPSRQLVVVRLGWTFKRGQFDGCQLVADVLKALPPL